MMDVYAGREGFGSTDLGLRALSEELKGAVGVLEALHEDEQLDVWARLGRQILRDPELMQVEGILYLGTWLRQRNLRTYLDDGLGPRDVSLAQGRRMAHPRGLVCHWVAGNTPTAAMFSLVQAALVGNASLVRASRRNLDVTRRILANLGDSVADRAVANAIALVSFPREDTSSHTVMSQVADCKVLWGDADAIATLKALPESDHCETVVFGPKYSFAVVGRDAWASQRLDAILEGLALDVVLFDQMACASPHVVFFEGAGDRLPELSRRLAAQLDRVSVKRPKDAIREDIAAKIVRARAEYRMRLDCDVFASPRNDWTVLVGGEAELVEAVQSRTVFARAVDDLDRVADQVGPWIQAIALEVEDPDRRLRLARRYGARGCSRCVRAGHMNDYGAVWDGLRVLDRFVRWSVLTP